MAKRSACSPQCRKCECVRRTLYFVLGLQSGRVGDTNRLAGRGDFPFSIGVVLENIAVENLSEETLACHSPTAAYKGHTVNQKQLEIIAKPNALPLDRIGYIRKLVVRLHRQNARNSKLVIRCNVSAGSWDRFSFVYIFYKLTDIGRGDELIDKSVTYRKSSHLSED